MTVDFRILNRYLVRPAHPLESPRSLVQEIDTGSSKYFSTFDASNGYHQVPLDKESRLLTTFITPWGRYCHNRASMGLASAGD